MTATDDNEKSRVDAGESFVAAAQQALSSGELAKVTDADLKRVLTAAVRLYSAKAEQGGARAEPIEASEVTPTDIVVLVSALINSVGLNLWDVSMWHNRIQPRSKN